MPCRDGDWTDENPKVPASLENREEYQLYNWLCKTLNLEAEQTTEYQFIDGSLSSSYTALLCEVINTRGGSQFVSELVREHHRDVMVSRLHTWWDRHLRFDKERIDAQLAYKIAASDTTPDLLMEIIEAEKKATPELADYIDKQLDLELDAAIKKASKELERIFQLRIRNQRLNKRK